MTRDFPESDWKLFRQLHPIAIDRYCRKILEEIQRVAADPKKTNHQRYLEIYKLIERRDREVARAFNDFRRSTAFIQLSIIYSYGVITKEELMRFTPDTQAAISLLLR
jgi:hypothetical protein